MITIFKIFRWLCTICNLGYNLYLIIYNRLNIFFRCCMFAEKLFKIFRPNLCFWCMWNVFICGKDNAFYCLLAGNIGVKSNAFFRYIDKVQ